MRLFIYRQSQDLYWLCRNHPVERRLGPYSDWRVAPKKSDLVTDLCTDIMDNLFPDATLGVGEYFEFDLQQQIDERRDVLPERGEEPQSGSGAVRDPAVDAGGRMPDSGAGT